MKINLNEAQSKILIDIMLKDLLPKELEKLRQKKQQEKTQLRSEQHGSTSAAS